MSNHADRFGSSEDLVSRSARAAFFREVDETVRATHPRIRVRKIRATFRRCRRNLAGTLSDTDLLGIAITWLIHVELARMMPPGPLDAKGFGLLRNQAARIALIALPEYAQPLVRSARAATTDAPSDDAELLALVHHVWMLDDFLASIRPEPDASKTPMDPIRRRGLGHAWLAILRASQDTLQFDPVAIRATAMAAFDPRRKDADGSWSKDRECPPEVHASSEFTAGLLEIFASQYDSLEYLAVTKERQLIANLRGIRDSIGTALGIERTRRTDALDRADGNIGPADIGPAVDAARQALSARAILDTLRDLLDVDTSTPEGRLVVEIASRLRAAGERGEIHLEDDGIVSILRGFLAECARLRSPAKKAALAHHLFGPQYTREVLARIFSCTERKVQLQADAAGPIAAKIRAIVAT